MALWWSNKANRSTNKVEESRELKGSRTLLRHNILGDVTINRSTRAKRISISLHPSGEIRLTIPLREKIEPAIAFLESRQEWISTAQQRIKNREDKREPLSAANKEEMTKIVNEANEYLPKRLLELAKLHGFNINRIAIRATRSRWGSCSSTNNISLSVYLIRLPRHLIDFVMIHELCHTRHHNHSAQFHELVNHYTAGREKELNNELRGYRCH